MKLSAQVQNSRGQTLVETLYVLPLLMLFFTTSVIVFLSARSFIYARFQLKESLICLEAHSVSTCRQQWFRNIKGQITFLHIQNFQLQKWDTRIQASFEYSFAWHPRRSWRLQVQNTDP